jgi:hypothetical protein
MTALAFLLILTALVTRRPGLGLVLAALVAAVRLWPLLLASLAAGLLVAVAGLAVLALTHHRRAPDPADIDLTPEGAPA